MKTSRKISAAQLKRLEIRAQKLASKGDFAAAGRALGRAARAQPERTELWRRAAMWKRRAGDFAAAVRLLRRGLAMHAYFAAAAVEIAAKSQKSSGDKSDRRVQAMLHAMQEETFLSGIASLWLGLAETYAEAQQWTASREACREVLRLEPNNHLALELISTCLLYTGQLEEAAAAMQTLLRLSPRDPLHRLKLATLLHLQGLLGDAAQEFARVARSFPDAPFAREAQEALEALDKLQIQHILMRAAHQHDFRHRLRHDLEETIEDSGFFLSDDGRESLRHMLWDGGVAEETPPLRIH